MNMDVIMVCDWCRRVRRVRRGVLGWENDQKGYLGVKDVCRYVCFVCVWTGTFRISCMGLRRGVRGKNDHEWVNMGAGGCNRVSKHIGAEIKRNRTHNNPQTTYLITFQNTETNKTN